MLRFEAHYLEDQGQIIVFDIPNNMMTGSMMRKERDEFNRLMNDRAMLDAELSKGAERARSVAQPVLQRVRSKIGF